MKQVNLDSSVKALVRFGISFLALMPLFAFNIRKLKTYNHKVYLLRALIASCAVLLTYKVYNSLPFASATSISLSEPLFSALLSFLILRESISTKKWIMLFMGYIGVIVSIWPIDFANKYIMLQGFLLIANILVSFNSIMIKQLSVKENAITVIFYLYVYIIPVLFLLNIILGNSVCIANMFTFENMRILIPIGILGAFNNLIMIYSLKKLPVSTFTSSQYFRIFLASAMSFYAGEHISASEVIGSIIIVISSAFI
nr:EamA family transporter [Candidatus Cytomitobacter primus]